MDKYFLDTEFIDTGSTIDLISIGIVCSDDRELYLQSCEFDPDKASPWVQEHVFGSLLVCPNVSGNVRGIYAHEGGQCTFTDHIEDTPGTYSDCPWRTRKQMMHEVASFFNPSDGFELWGWCAGYDFVALCQLFGTMMDLPQGWPHHIKEFQQILDERGISDEELPTQEDGLHNALADAKHLKKLWGYIMKNDCWQ